MNAYFWGCMMSTCLYCMRLPLARSELSRQSATCRLRCPNYSYGASQLLHAHTNTQINTHLWRRCRSRAGHWQGPWPPPTQGPREAAPWASPKTSRPSWGYRSRGGCRWGQQPQTNLPAAALQEKRRRNTERCVIRVTWWSSSVVRVQGFV
eukprot:scaffold211265_cov20-Tisochrysis_lutea.AAC.1